MQIIVLIFHILPGQALANDLNKILPINSIIVIIILLHTYGNINFPDIYPSQNKSRYLPLAKT